MARIYISIGSNTRRDYHVRSAVKALKQQFGAVQLSSVYESEAVGFVGEPFYNLVAAADTLLSVAECVALFKQIEDQFVYLRITRIPDYPCSRVVPVARTVIDIASDDIESFGGVILHDNALRIPAQCIHGSFSQRN